MHELLALLEKIPATFGGVVAGSFFTLIGVWLTNRGNDRRLERQLSNDRDLRKIERELALRKDIYLAAVEAMATGITAIGRFADIEVPSNKLTEAYTEKSPTIFKVHAIAGEKTVKTVVHFISELSAANLQLLTKRNPLRVQNDQRDILMDSMRSFKNEFGRIVELMQQHELDGVETPKRWESMKRLSDYQKSAYDEARRQYSVVATNFFAKLAVYMAECEAESARLNQLLISVLVAMREELELPISEHVYVQTFEQFSKKIQENMREYAENARHFATAQFSEEEEQH